MIEEIAKITKMDAENIWIEIKKSNGCHGCASRSSCGTSALSQLFGNKVSVFQISHQPEAEDLKIGDEVLVGIEDRQYVSASFLIYLLPLLFMFSLSLLFDQVFALSDFWVLLVILFGLGSGFMVANVISRQLSKPLQPQLIKKMPLLN